MKKEKALEMLEKGEITFSKAAKMADTDLWTFSKKVNESGITWIKMKTEELRRETKKL